jgi:Kef-type K+ transport system membrane component KefB
MISLAQTAVLLAAAVVTVSLFRLLNLSSILGYVAAGLVIGPWGLRLVQHTTSITHIADFGVVLLLFIIGLELQPTRLWVMRRIVFGLGMAQVLLCTVLLGGAANLLGLAPLPAGIVGFGLSLSSTPLVLQILAERGQLKSQTEDRRSASCCSRTSRSFRCSPSSLSSRTADLPRKRPTPRYGRS